ncbi:hypothetical protein BDV37DRAFT_255563 [Aspergillus pseudonomiae]|uniref:Uncharacterized protein n=1 Tax=Aspergillus pseudonomiae TaxID=1506151 RepID=A0A5N7D5U9_9EURO|nr:uncharacterized protein BDV37DRAFT_255563 [Aspergillus pseudonomiae]KAE8401283.1 hypothetical protein BDV37DRAFT_255563 [Aspergillus pseudonomiae]
MVLRAPWHPSDNKNKFLTIGRNTKSCLSLKYCPYQLDVTTEALSVIKIGFSISREAGLTYIYIYMYTSVYTMNVCTIISIPWKDEAQLNTGSRVRLKQVPWYKVQWTDRIGSERKALMQSIITLSPPTLKQIGKNENSTYHNVILQRTH